MCKSGTFRAYVFLKLIPLISFSLYCDIYNLLLIFTEENKIHLGAEMFSSLKMREILLSFLRICFHAAFSWLTQILVTVTVSFTGNTVELLDLVIHSEFTICLFTLWLENERTIYFHSFTKIVIEADNKCCN